MCMCGVLLDCEDELRGSFSVLQPFCGKEERFGQGLWPNTEACFWSDIRKVKKVFERWDNYLIL